jgi:hypothetical protein
MSMIAGIVIAIITIIFLENILFLLALLCHSIVAIFPKVPDRYYSYIIFTIILAQVIFFIYVTLLPSLRSL